MSRDSVALLLLLGLASCSKTVDPWSAATLFTSLSDSQQTLPCVPDPLLYLRALRPELERMGPMPSDHACLKDKDECLAHAKKNFCGSALEQRLQAESREFKIE
ncbi:MAG: hypothetical protein ACLGG7_12195 [Bacteriovoracia bacterium]